MKRFVQEWLYHLSDEQLFRASIGQNPSIADIIRMKHPKPADETRAALYAYLIGQEYDHGKLPKIVKDYEAFKNMKNNVLPELPFTFLTCRELSKKQWRLIAERSPWQTTRMNPNTFQRHGVFEHGQGIKAVASKLRNPKLIQKAKVFISIACCIHEC